MSVKRHAPHLILCLTMAVGMVAAQADVSAGREILETTPSSFFASANPSNGLTVGDVDLDGDLDVVFANTGLEFGYNNLYRGEGGGFPAGPITVTGISRYSRGAAIGDLDGDGDMDLVFANQSGDPNTVHYQVEGAFDPSSSWNVELLSDTRSLALGDFDQDGFLDIALGNSGQANTIYRGSENGPSGTPAWSSEPINATVSVAWGDVDGDGWLDLVCGNSGQPNTVYLNGPAGMATQPTYLLGGTESTFGIALGDLDGDGWLDIVCANSGGSGNNRNTVHLSTGGVFAQTPSYTFTEEFESRAVALGDADGDGDLDVAFGNYNDSNILFLNEGGSTWGVWAWKSDQENSTQDIAFADVTGDGWLDLVSANYSDENKYYTNIWGPVGRDSAWPQAPDGALRGMDLGDVDGDGDLDLAVGYGNPNGPPDIFLNQSGVLDSLASWTGSSVAYTYDVALGDINGNGLPDLVCGQFSTDQVLGAPNEVYLDVGPGAATTPAWYSGQSNSTTGVALGDIDRDGDLDLVCGNKIDPNTMYLNKGGTFSSNPDWEAGQASETQAVILVDIDQDGWLDLFFGNASNRASSLYLNKGGTFEQEPDWEYHTAFPTRSLAWGDIDGDGWPEVLCGNDSQANILFPNLQGTLGEYVELDQQNYLTFGVSLGDLDGDGDLDLACANFGHENTIHRNVNGAFVVEPAWESTIAEQTRDLALGDLDLDGDLDLVYGNLLVPSLVHRGGAEPYFPGVPGTEAGQSTAHAAFVRDVLVAEGGSNTYGVEFTLVDFEADPVWLVAEYSFEGSPDWHPADLGGGSSPLGPLASSAGGIVHQATWDVSLALIDRRPATLRLRPVSPPRTIGLVSELPSFLEGVGPLAVQRPEILATPGLLDFPIVTVGDTVTVPLEISNTGTEALDFTGIDFPHTEFLYSPPAASVPLIQPGEKVALQVSLVPRTEIAVPGDLEVLSSDPLTGRYPVAVASDVKALEFESRLLSPADEAPLGEAITVIVTPGRDVRVEGGFLFHRAAGAADFVDSIPLAVSEGDFIAVIPGASVTELGLEYYIRVENSGVFASDPNGAPGDAVHAQAVASPVQLVSSAPFTSSLGYLDGQPIRIEARLAAGTVFDSGILHYRQGGAAAFHTVPVDLEGDLPVGVIPDSMVGPRGIEYWMEVATRTAELVDPSTGSDGPPHVLTVAVTNMAEPAVVPARTYRMIGIPLVLPDEFEGTLEAMLFDQPGFGSYDPTRWRCFRYAPGSNRYLELSSSETEFRPEPGRAYWLVSHQAGALTTAPVSGQSTGTARPWSITLKPGWNQVGHPFAFPVAWDDATVDGMPMAEAQEGLSIEAPVAWDWETRDYVSDVGVLEPFGGYWIRNLEQADMVLAIPPTAYEQTATKAWQEEGPEWIVSISVDCSGVRDGGVTAGSFDRALTGRDPFDSSRPPAQPGRALTLYFPHGDWKGFAGPYRKDLRPLDTLEGSKGIGWGLAWDFDVTKNFADDGIADEIVLSLAEQNVPEEFRIVLTDRVTGTETDWKAGQPFTVHLGMRDPVSHPAEARFRLVVGDEAFLVAHDEFEDIPRQTALHRNRPNPFNPATLIPFSLHKPERVTMTVHDLRGARVANLTDQVYEPGRYEVMWRGVDDSGRQAGAGVYFVRMRTAGGSNFTTKITLVK